MGCILHVDFKGVWRLLRCISRCRCIQCMQVRQMTLKEKKVKPSYSKESKQKENLPFLGAAASAPFTSTAAWRPWWWMRKPNWRQRGISGENNTFNSIYSKIIIRWNYLIFSLKKEFNARLFLLFSIPSYLRKTWKSFPSPTKNVIERSSSIAQW